MPLSETNNPFSKKNLHTVVSVLPFVLVLQAIRKILNKPTPDTDILILLIMAGVLWVVGACTYLHGLTRKKEENL